MLYCMIMMFQFVGVQSLEHTVQFVYLAVLCFTWSFSCCGWAHKMFVLFL